MAQGSLPSAYGGHNTAHQASFEAMQASKKKKKQRMVRADPSILGTLIHSATQPVGLLSAQSSWGSLGCAPFQEAREWGVP